MVCVSVRCSINSTRNSLQIPMGEVFVGKLVILNGISGFKNEVGRSLKMDGRVWHIVWIVSSLLSWLSASQTLVLTDKEKYFLQTHPRITLGIGEGWDPYAIERRDGTITGYAQDILARINQATGAHFVLTIGNWSQLQQRAADGKIDGLSCLIETAERKKWLAFSKHVAYLHKALYTQRNSPLKIRTVQDLRNKVVVIEKENVADKKLVASLHMKVLDAPSSIACFQMLLEGKAEVTIGTSITPYQLRKFGFPNLKKIYDFHPNLSLRFAVRKEYATAIDILNKGLGNISLEEKDALRAKWFSYNSSHFKLFLNKRDQEYLSRKRVLGMCVDPDWKPFEYINKKGKYEGILADYVSLFSSRLDIPFVLHRTLSYRESITALKEGKCDLVVGDVATPNRQKYFLATTPYLNVSRAFVTHVDSTNIHDFSQIAYRGKIGVLKDSPAEASLARMYEKIQIVPCESSKEGVLRVASRELSAFVGTLPSLVYELQEQGLSNVKIAGTFVEPVRLSMLVTKHSEVLRSILNKVVDTLTEKDRRKILLKWVEVKYVKGVDRTLLYLLLILFVLLLLFLGTRHYTTLQMKKKLEVMHRKLEAEMKKEIEKNRHQQLMMLHQNRLAQKGEMLQMIAHQWRQPLNTLSLVNQKLIYAYKKERMTAEEIAFFEEKSQQLIQQMSEIINTFKDFFKPDKKRVEFDMYHVVAHTVSLLEPVMNRHHIHIALEGEKEICYYGFPNEFGQAVINILTNAKDILVERQCKNPQINIRVWRERQKIHVYICDNGGGIPPSIISQIFEPYFSTKEEKNGTGLGLYMCKLIVEGHFKGHLSVENRDEGACFSIVI